MPVEGWLLIGGLLAVWCLARTIRAILGLLALGATALLLAALLI